MGELLRARSKTPACRLPVELAHLLVRGLVSLANEVLCCPCELASSAAVIVHPSSCVECAGRGWMHPHSSDRAK